VIRIPVVGLVEFPVGGLGELVHEDDHSGVGGLGILNGRFGGTHPSPTRRIGQKRKNTGSNWLL
jgi:hypothetical protein